MLFNRSKKMMNAGKALALLLPVLLLLPACGEEEKTPVYTVTFNANGGSAIEPEKVESGKQATRPTDPAKAGHTFGGWYSDKALSKAFDFTKPITADITLYAKWVEEVMVTHNAATHTITGLKNKYKGIANLHLKIPARIGGVAMTTIAAGAFKNQTNITALTLPEGITTIAGSANVLTNRIFSSTNGAFEGCSSISGSLSLPRSLTEIGAVAFYDCTSFTGSLTIGNAVTEIGNSAFSGCTGFTGNLTIGSDVTEISYWAFARTRFTTVVALPTRPPVLFGSSVFPKVITSIQVPAGSVAEYQTAHEWMAHSAIIREQ